MNDPIIKSLFVVLTAGSMTLGVGCFGSDGGDDDASGGTGGSAGSAGTGGGSANGVVILPDETGWVDGMAEWNTIGVQGAWYPYGDAYGVEKKCVTAGHDAATECAIITTPDPAAMSFPNTGGKMCTSGSVAKVIDVPGMAGTPDYSNIWGAGIGLDLNATPGDNATKSPFDFVAHGFTGIYFEIDMVPLPGLRVEFPMPATEGHADGSDYWGASMNYPNSPVMAGGNTIKWADIKAPRGAIPFDATQVLSIQFHVPSSTAGAGTFSYCISNLTFITN